MPETIAEISGTKIWNDSNNQDGKRPSSVTVELFANGVKKDSRTITAADNWKYSFTDLPKYDSGTEITYAVTEEPVAGYVTTVDANNNITNTHTPETIAEISGTKIWNDSNNQDGKRPDKVTVELFANGELKESKTVTAEDSWKYSFTDLPKYENGGKEIVYSIAEAQVDDYSSEVTGYDITNTYTPEMISVAGQKIWNDNNDRDGKRPAGITVHLRLNGEIIDTRTVSASDGWRYSFTNLPKYENGGHLINYTVTENTVEGYTSAVDGYNITNSYTPGETGITVTKKWDDGNDRDGIRPDSITVRLLADGADTGDSVTLSAANNWSAQFTGLALNKDGKTISYTVSEDQVSGYEKPVITGDAEKGFVITNTHTPKAQPEEPNGKDKPARPSGGKPSGSSGNKPSGTGSNGSNSTGSSSGTRSGSSAKTGDTANITLYLILMIAAAGVLVGLIRKKK